MESRKDHPQEDVGDTGGGVSLWAPNRSLRNSALPQKLPQTSSQISINYKYHHPFPFSMSETNDGLFNSLTNISWGVIFIGLGSLWLLFSLGFMGLPENLGSMLGYITPVGLIILGFIIFLRDDGKLEEIKP